MLREDLSCDGYKVHGPTCRGAGFTCLPLHSAGGSGSDDPILQLLHTGSLRDARVLVPFAPHSTTARLGHISAQERCLCPFSSVPTTLPTSHRAQEAAQASCKENRNQTLIGEIALLQGRIMLSLDTGKVPETEVLSGYELQGWVGGTNTGP